MSRKIDERVVEMQFDNRRFESNVKTSMSTLDKLKQKLNLTGASKGLEEVSKASKGFSMRGVTSAVEAVQAKFSAFQVVAVTALANITNQAVNTGKRMVSALTIDPIKTGFQEYETQMGAIQTILANTESKGSTLQDVNRVLAELNTYADKTIYNFTEMTKNIGTFTAAGVELDTAVSSIKGIANLAAVSGSTSQQASTAMYQLSQALAAGRVSLMDWNSVVNAGMGGEVFQNALKRTARQMGHNVDAMIEKYGSFRESLTQGNWLTTEVLTETLTQLSGAYTEADLIAQGYTEEQAKQITKLAETAVSAATEVKTFTQLWDTLKEAAQSGWSQSWQTIVGDFGEAKELLTGISNTIGDIIGKSAEARNKLLSGGLSTGWKQFLNQGVFDEEMLRDTISGISKNKGVELDKFIEEDGSFEKTLKRGWMTADILTESINKMGDELNGLSEKQLKERGITSSQIEEFNKLRDAINDGTISASEFANKMSMQSGRENVIAGLANVFKTLGTAIAPIKEAFRDIFPAMTGDQLYALTENFRKLTEQFKIGDETIGKIKRTFSGVFSIFDLFGKAIKTILSPLGDFATGGALGSIADIILSITASIGDFFTAINNSTGVGNFLEVIRSSLSSLFGGIADALGLASENFDSFGGILSSIGDVIGNVLGKIGEGIKWISDHVSFGDIFAGLAGGGIFVAAKKFGGLLDGIKDKISELFSKKEDSGGLLANFKEVMGGVKDTLSSFTTGIKATTLLTIAGAVGILSMALRSMSEIDAGNLIKGLAGVGALLFMMNKSFKGLTGILSGFEGGGTLKSGIALIAMATVLKILSTALVDIGSLDLAQLAKGLVGIGISLYLMQGALKTMGKTNVSLKTSGAIIAVAEACKMIAGALADIGKLGWEEIAKGLVGMGAALVELVIAIKYLDKFNKGNSVKNAASLYILTLSLGKIGDALKEIGSLGWKQIAKGLGGIGGALAELVIALGIMNKFKNVGSIKDSAALLIAAQTLKDISESLEPIGKLRWEEIARGLSGIGGVLAELVVALGIMNKFKNVGAIKDSAALLIAVQTLKDISEALEPIGKLGWEEIARGLSGIGGVLVELAATLGIMNTFKHTGAMKDSVALLIAAQTLNDIAEALAPIGKLSWEEIARGLVGMGGALAELTAALAALSFLSTSTGGIGAVAQIVAAGSLWIAIQGLSDLAEALQKFGQMSWDEIGRGLTAMLGAMGATGLGGLLNTVSGLGAITLNISVKPLMDLADALERFGQMSWDEIDKGVKAMTAAMGATGIGGLANTLSGLGALSIAAVAGPLGVLADSVKKWVGIEVPETLGANLVDLAGGVMAFNFSGWGADAIAAVAVPLGDLAGSIQKWANVVIPDGLGEQLKSLAPGVESFNFSGWGADAIAAVAVPLGDLAGSISKWSGVVIPEELGEQLKTLAPGIQAFNFSGWAADDMGDIVTPLTNLAGAVQAWSGVVLPEGMKQNLIDLSTGIKSFDNGWFGSYGDDINSTIQPLKDLAGAVREWNNVVVPVGLGDNLSNLAGGLETLSSVTVGDLTSTYDAIKNIATVIQDVSGVDFSSAISGLTGFATAVSNIKVSTDSFSNIGTKMVDSLITSINLGRPRAIVASSALVTSILISISNKSKDFTSAGVNLINSLANGVKIASVNVTTASTLMMNNVITSVSETSSKFYEAGTAAASGFADGIRDGAYSSQMAAYAMGIAAAKAAKEAIKSNSPSKLFRDIGTYVPQGFAIGIGMMGNLIKSSTNDMTDTAVNSATKAVGRMSDIITSDVDTQPVIRPIVDLDDVYAGAKTISDSLSLNPSIGVMSNIRSISSAMSQRSQNGVNDDVVDAIRKLDKSIRNNPRTVNNINGISYDDGSNVTDAIATIIRAAKIERRS